MLAAPAWADYDAAGEARAAAQRKAGASRQAGADTAARNTTGRTTGELQNMSNQDAQALAAEMHKKYGK